MSDNVSPVEQVPAELWMVIFELLETPRDLISIVQTCRSFYNYAIRALHRNIVWKTPTAFVHNIPFWRDAPQVLLDSVQSLDLGVSTLPDYGPGLLVDRDGWTFMRQDRDPLYMYPDGPWVDEDAEDVHNLPIIKSIKFYKIEQSFATTDLYASLIGRLTSFTKLRTLRLENLFFTDELFGALHMLPSLRTLHIESCFFPRKKNVTARDHSTLPITELTMLNLYRQVLRGGQPSPRDDANFAQFADMDEDISYALNIASARNLRTLRVDSTADVFALVYRRREHGVYLFKIPENLTHLFVLRKRIIKNAVQPTYHSEQLFPIAVYAILDRCPTLTTVSLGYPLPKHQNFPKYNTLPNLTHCEGTLETILALTVGRPVRALSILRSEAPLENILDTLARKAQSHPELEMLSLHCKVWDLEILDAICQLFPKLRKLRLTFDVRKPGKLWEHTDYWDDALQPYELYPFTGEARGQPEATPVSHGPDEVCTSVIPVRTYIDISIELSGHDCQLWSSLPLPIRASPHGGDLCYSVQSHC